MRFPKAGFGHFLAQRFAIDPDVILLEEFFTCELRAEIHQIFLDDCKRACDESWIVLSVRSVQAVPGDHATLAVLL